MTRTTSPIAIAVTATLAGFVVASAAAASEPLTPARLNAGYGQGRGDLSRPVDPTMRDGDGNLLIINGLIQAGQANGVWTSGGYGVSPSVAGAQAVAIGNQLTVQTYGSGNTIVVDNRQTNSGQVKAVVELNGKVNLDAR